MSACPRPQPIPASLPLKNLQTMRKMRSYLMDTVLDAKNASGDARHALMAVRDASPSFLERNPSSGTPRKRARTEDTMASAARLYSLCWPHTTTNKAAWSGKTSGSTYEFAGVHNSELETPALHPQMYAPALPEVRCAPPTVAISLEEPPESRTPTPAPSPPLIQAPASTLPVTPTPTPRAIQAPTPPPPRLVIRLPASVKLQVEAQPSVRLCIRVPPLQRIQSTSPDELSPVTDISESEPASTITTPRSESPVDPVPICRPRPSLLDAPAAAETSAQSPTAVSAFVRRRGGVR
ncbi:hypothetical protein MKEN_01028500 [Mycena kentingensis (nom. inval.)]|nr:hypothetical protein MKEN_01028500 [Mycena kentingensis (nom. inval.)]